MKKPQSIPSEFKTKCIICGEVLDIRDLQSNLCHNVLDEELKEFTCLNESEIQHIKGFTKISQSFTNS